MNSEEVDTQQQQYSFFSSVGSIPLTVLLGVVTIVALLGVGGYLVAMRRNQVLPPPETGRNSIQGSPTPQLPVSPSLTSESHASPTPDSTVGWKTYTNNTYGYTVRYPPLLMVHEQPTGTGPTRPGTTKFYSPQALPQATMPEDREAAKEFVEQYTLIFFEVYDNPTRLPLKQALKQIYSQPSIAFPKTVFELMELGFQPYKGHLYEALIYTGSPKETPLKRVFFSYNARVYVVTLLGGPNTGSGYSATAEKIFDGMISNLEVVQ